MNKIKTDKKISKCYFCNKDIRETSLAYSTKLLKKDCWKEEYLVCICKDCHIKIEKFNNKIFDFLKKEQESEVGK